PKKDDFLKHEHGSGHKAAFLAITGVTYEESQVTAGDGGQEKTPTKAGQKNQFHAGDVFLMNSMFNLSSTQDTGVTCSGESCDVEEFRREIKTEEHDFTSGSEEAKDAAALFTPAEVVVPPLSIHCISSDQQDAASEGCHSVPRDEFYQFGMHVASQLSAMPLRAALEVQLDIQRVLTMKRLQCLE
ncbi:hypothetical protein OTU49_010293, partial [Cherax quadricarinatus]